MLPSVLPRLATDSATRVFPDVWKIFSFKTPFLGWSSLPTSFVSFFHLLYFSYLFLKTMIRFSGCPMSSASIQKLFCEVYSALKCSFEEFVRENVVSPSYSSAILGPLSMILVFRMLRFKPAFSLFSFTFIKRLFSFSSLYAIWMVSFAYLGLLIFLLAVLIPAYASSSLAFCMMYSAYKLNNQGENIHL